MKIRIRINYVIDVTKNLKLLLAGLYTLLLRLIKPLKYALLASLFIFMIGTGRWIWLHKSQPREKYAVLISPGKTILDDKMIHSEYWNDLVMTYKSLMEQGYTHENIYVFYGDSARSDFKSKYSYLDPGWYFGVPRIVDYSNREEDMIKGFEELNYRVTRRDKLTIYWVVGHGIIPLFSKEGYNKYEVCFERWDSTNTNMKLAVVLKDTIINLINSIEDYKQREIYWLTCFSGSIIMGDIQLGDTRTTVITSSRWNQFSFSSCHDGFDSDYFSRFKCMGYVSGDFNWEMYGILHNKYFNETKYDPYDKTLKYPITPYKIYRELTNSGKIMDSAVQIGGQSPTVIYIKTVRGIKSALARIKKELIIIWNT